MSTADKGPILTQKEFWEKEWNELELPIVLDPTKRADRSFIHLFKKYLSIKDGSEKSCIEIGSNPGKFIIFAAKYLNYDISGVDYDEKGCLFTQKNIKAAGLNVSIYKQDIFDFDIDKKYDLVISCGFVEHFEGEKLDEVLKKHIDLLKDGGRLFLSVPNFRYLNYIFSYFFRKDMLEVHNLEIMQKSFFEEMAIKNNLEVEFLDYFGGLHPGGIKLPKNNSFNKFIMEKLIGSSQKSGILDHLNSKYFSHHLGAVYKKLSDN
jgi:2-polyprenyl-3-methyl-5-hydroxy-6-metoxy-1,4-benzoquinol methylase